MRCRPNQRATAKRSHAKAFASTRDKLSLRCNSRNTKVMKAVVYEEVAERGGFEPPIQFNPYNGLANRRLQPLGHLSCLVLSLFVLLLRGLNAEEYTAKCHFPKTFAATLRNEPKTVFKLVRKVLNPSSLEIRGGQAGRGFWAGAQLRTIQQNLSDLGRFLLGSSMDEFLHAIIEDSRQPLTSRSCQSEYTREKQS